MEKEKRWREQRKKAGIGREGEVEVEVVGLKERLRRDVIRN